mmetsp:Transcript_26452/g.82822  ORF Transcript_26452/g.82822 Transcript_26452/m.82822 type:complete len:203 (-) Transcript_26452:236-844(-)
MDGFGFQSMRRRPPSLTMRLPKPSSFCRGLRPRDWHTRESALWSKAAPASHTSRLAPSRCTMRTPRRPSACTRSTFMILSRPTRSTPGCPIKRRQIGPSRFPTTPGRPSRASRRCWRRRPSFVRGCVTRCVSRCCTRLRRCLVARRRCWRGGAAGGGRTTPRCYDCSSTRLWKVRRRALGASLRTPTTRSSPCCTKTGRGCS